MSDTTGTERAPLGVRLLAAVQQEPDWPTLTEERLIAYREAANRRAGSRFLRPITGFPASGVEIRWQELVLADRVVRIRVYRPRTATSPLPLIVHVHGGAVVGTAAQCDWANSHFAAHLPAVVVSVEHRLIDPRTPLTAAVDDDWDVLTQVRGHAADWGIDPDRIAVAGESGGALISALTAIRARDAGLPLRAQVLVNPVTDVSESAFDHPSMTRYPHTPTLHVDKLRWIFPLAAAGSEARAVSPRYADATGLAPALVVVPVLDPLADHGRRYVERLREFGTPARLSEHPGAPHAFLALPGLVPQARAARAAILGFLRERLAAHPAVEPAEQG
ncbi:alpha/beta hydrolase [Nocardia sp. 2]|uniref:Alpha/beta hydrolase n=1 Tax=Nocardia acididurans TaxID=2802282 RepID=A0ABS1M152_9NOCA|nr:alpha/beta hydrolase [Nocardia acididurans]MBL1073785.1 alpha/beta hydrolase [Nocardia acididurans]